MTTNRFAIGAVAACAMVTAISCSDSSPTAPGATGTAFQVRLLPEGSHTANGIMRFEIVGSEFIARTQALGVEPNQHIPQHIHLNPTCNPGGGVLINLDKTLTVAGEAPGIGTAYPMADASGYLNYEARRPVADLIAAVNRFFPAAGVQDVEGLLAFLDLEDRNGHMHVAFGPPFPAVNCGEIDRTN